MSASPPSISAIVDNRIYIGNLASATSQEVKNELGITHVLSICPDYPHTSSPKHLVVNVEDSEMADLLIHLPAACRFVSEALDSSPTASVLIHCRMGVSRSTTVLAAFLMKTKHLTRIEALTYIRQRRSQVHPNYGFLKQLDVFEQCLYQPSRTNPVYISWKRTHKQKLRSFLNQISDTTPIIPHTLYLSSDFPTSDDQAECLLYDLKITHFISISPVDLPPSLPSSVVHHVSVGLGSTVSFMTDALRAPNGRVLVHSSTESKACIAVAAYLMRSRNIGEREALAEIKKALPLFYSTPNITRHLDAFARGAHVSSLSDPAIASHCNVVQILSDIPNGMVTADVLMIT